MSDSLRVLLAEFVVEIDKAGALKRGNVEVEALKDRLHELQTIMQTIRTPAAKAAKTVQDVFARAAQAATTNLAAIQAKRLGGRSNDDGFMAAGLAGGLIKAKREADAAANSFGARLKRGFDQAAAGAANLAAKLKPSSGGLLAGLTSLRAGIAGLALGAGARFAKGFIDQVGGIGEAAAKLGVTTDEFQRLDVLAKQNATSVEALGTAFRNLGRVAGDPTKDSAAAFGALGVSTKDSNGALKSRQDLFFETAGALADVGNETKRAQLATQLFGRSGTELLPMLANGRAGLEAQRAELEKLAIISGANIEAADDFGDRWEVSAAGLRAKLLPVLLRLVPVFEGALDVVGKIADTVANTGRAFDMLAASSSGGAGAVRALKFSLDLLLLPLKLIEDFIVFLAGGKSRLGQLLEQAFGADNGVAETIRAFFDGIFGGFNELAAFLNGETSYDEFGNRFLAITADMSEAIDALFDKVLGLPERLARAATELGAVGTVLRSLPVIGPLLTASGAAIATAEAAPSIGQGLAEGLMMPTIANPGLPAAAAGIAAPIDQRTQSVTVNVGSTAEVAGAVAGAQRGMGRDAAADLAAVQ